MYETLIKRQDLEAKLSNKFDSTPNIRTLYPNTCAQYAICTLIPEINYEKLCSEMNPGHQVTSAKKMIDYLDSKIGAEAHTDGRLEDLKHALDRGRKVIAFTSSAQDNPHWIVINDYKTDSSGRITAWEVIDTSFSFGKPGGKILMSNEEFKYRWANPDPNQNQYSNYWIETGTNKTIDLEFPRVTQSIINKSNEITELLKMPAYKRSQLEDTAILYKEETSLKSVFNNIYTYAKNILSLFGIKIS